MTGYSVEAAIAEVCTDVETVLQTRFGLEHPEDKYRDYISEQARSWRKVLSVYPDKVNPRAYYLFYDSTPKAEEARVFSDCIRGECTPISIELGICLLEAGINVMSGFNGLPEGKLQPCHEYLVTSRRGHEILIDPTIAQMIQGHNYVFVGTRDQLREIVLHGINPEGPYNRLRSSDLRNHTKEAFELNWGTKARVAPFILQHFFFDVTKMRITPLV